MGECLQMGNPYPLRFKPSSSSHARMNSLHILNVWWLNFHYLQVKKDDNAYSFACPYHVLRQRFAINVWKMLRKKDKKCVN